MLANGVGTSNATAMTMKVKMMTIVNVGKKNLELQLMMITQMAHDGNHNSMGGNEKIGNWRWR